MDFQRRFSGLGRLYGKAALERLRTCSIAVIGVGGVGSWTVEALARTGVGRLVLIDMDDVCISNTNRQLPAMDGNVGRLKVEVLAERVRLINPACEVIAEPTFFTRATAGRLLAERFDAVVDAIDAIDNKCRLIAECRARSLPLIVCGGVGGRIDPTGIRHADLAKSRGDPLLAKVRKELRRQHGFPAAGCYGIDSVYSEELPRYPWADGSVCESKEPGTGTRLNCEEGFGTACYVSGAMGFAAAARAVEAVLGSGPTAAAVAVPAPAGKATRTARSAPAAAEQTSRTGAQ